MTAFRSSRAAQLLASTSQSSTRPAPFAYTLGVWKIGLALTFVFNTAVALLLSAFYLTPGDLYTNFVYSNSIGFLILAGILVPRTLLWQTRRPRPLIMALLAVLGMAFGLFAGRALAAWICGQPVHWRTGVLEETSTFITSLVISVFATLTSIIYFWTREREAVFSLHTAEVREKAEIVSRELTETQLRLLRAQIEPHMLFNTLSNLRALITQDPKAAQNMLDRLIDFFRASLDASRTEWSSLQREFDLVSDYLSLIAIRLGSRLTFELDLPAALASVQVPSMLIQPLVENAIKHGIEPALDGGKVRVQVRPSGDYVELVIEDNGVGLRLISTDPMVTDSALGGGFGNQHLRQRLHNLYGDRARFELKPMTPHGTSVHIVLPISPTP
jgi:signal transduction histidine kinase